MKHYRTRKACAALLMAAFLLALCVGCGAQAAEIGTEQAAERTRTLGLLMSRDDPFLSELEAEIEAQAAARGYAIQYYNAGGDAETQLRQVHQALASGVETLIVNLTDGQDSEGIANIVGDAGVVLVNRAPETAVLNDKMVYVGSDEAQSGVLQGQALAQYFWQTRQGTDFRYLLFLGVPGQENTDARSAGAIQTLMDSAFIPVAAAESQVCGFSREQAREAMAKLLEQDVEFDCVICCNDEMALGVIEALEAAGRDPSQAPIVSVDCTADGAAALEAGTLYMTVDQNAQAQAAAAVTAAINLNQGKAYDTEMEEVLGANYALSQQPYTVRVAVRAVTAV